jgi:hypothetical protein
MTFPADNEISAFELRQKIVYLVVHAGFLLPRDSRSLVGKTANICLPLHIRGFIARRTRRELAHMRANSHPAGDSFDDAGTGIPIGDLRARRTVQRIITSNTTAASTEIPGRRPAGVSSSLPA